MRDVTVQSRFPGAESPPCPICASPRVAWRLCKVICGNCGTIVQSCADL